MKPAPIITFDKELSASQLVRKMLLGCGIISSLLYISVDIIAAMWR